MSQWFNHSFCTPQRPLNYSPGSPLRQRRLVERNFYGVRTNHTGVYPSWPLAKYAGTLEDRSWRIEGFPTFEEAYAFAVGYNHYDHASLEPVRTAMHAYRSGTYSPPTEYRICPEIPPVNHLFTHPPPENVLPWPDPDEQSHHRGPGFTANTPLNTRTFPSNLHGQATPDPMDPPPAYSRAPAPVPPSPPSPSPTPAAAPPHPGFSTPTVEPISPILSTHTPATDPLSSISPSPSVGYPNPRAGSPSPSDVFSNGVGDISFTFNSDATSRVSQGYDASLDNSQFSDFSDLGTQIGASDIRTPDMHNTDLLDFDSLANALHAETGIADDGSQGLSFDLGGLQLGDSDDEVEPSPARSPRTTTPINPAADSDDEIPRGVFSPEPSPSRIRCAFIPESLSTKQQDFLNLYHDVDWDSIFGLTRKLQKNILIGRDVEDVRADFLYIFSHHGMNDAQAKLFGRWVFGPEPL